MGTPTLLIVLFLLICKGFSLLLKTGFWSTVLVGIIITLITIIIVVVSAGHLLPVL